MGQEILTYDETYGRGAMMEYSRHYKPAASLPIDSIAMDNQIKVNKAV